MNEISPQEAILLDPLFLQQSVTFAYNEASVA